MTNLIEWLFAWLGNILPITLVSAIRLKRVIFAPIQFGL